MKIADRSTPLRYSIFEPELSKLDLKNAWGVTALSSSNHPFLATTLSFLSSRVLDGPAPTYEDENGFYSATSLPVSAALPFVISTGAQRNGEISVWMPLLGNVFRRSEAEGSAVPRSPPGNPE
jgi:hypothetical protein